MNGFISRIFGKPAKKEVFKIEHKKCEVITVPPYVEDGSEFDRVVRDEWKLILSDETFELLFTDHPHEPTALLDGKPVEPQLGQLCVEAFFLEEKKEELLLLLKKHSKNEDNFLDFNLW